MASITASEKKKLFNKIRVLLGAPIREIELLDEMLEVYLEVAMEDYSKYINEWLIEQQWDSLIGLDTNNADLSFALMTRSLDFTRSFTYAYSKQVGLGTNGPWELKQDYVTLTAGTQYYIIPANREVNEVLWHTPAFVGSGLDPLSSSLWSAQQFGWNYAGTAAGYVQPLYNTLLAAQDKAIKNKVRKSELSYRITSMADGTKKLHLYPVPGGQYDPTSTTSGATSGDKIWYWYYDTNSGGSKKCINQNRDIIRVPSDVDIDDITWSQLNKPSQTFIREYMLAISKAALGKVRGKYSGALDITDAEVTMDYADLVAEGKEEKTRLIDELKEKLARLNYAEIMKRKAEEAQALNTVLGYIPLGIKVI